MCVVSVTNSDCDFRTSLRVGIDTSILAGPLAGIGRFTLSLVQALARRNRAAEWVLLGAPPGLDGLPDGLNVVLHRVGDLTGARRVAWQQAALPQLASRYGLDILHCPDFSRPVLVSVPVVSTIHDLSYYSPDGFFGPGRSLYKRLLTSVTIKKSSRIVADSIFTSDELQQRFALPAPSVSVIYLGVDPNGPVEPRRVERPFVLFVGTLEERKNLVALLHGFALMRAKGSISHRLVLAGKPGRGFDKIRAAIQASLYIKDIDIMGYVDRATVRELYRSADAVVMPSLYEGFGLPVLEAMAAGTPVVCSRAASLPEVGGDAAEYFDPASPQEISATLTRVLESESLRSEMRRRGLERAKQFTWDECARRYCEVYAAAARRPT